MDESSRYQQATIHTAENLRSIASDPNLRHISKLSLPEVDAVSGLVARMVPAGNVPGVILNALAHLAGPKVPSETVERDIHLLFRGVEQTLGRALYAAVFAGPGAILWGYQNLLRLAGKSPEAAFPNGVWQFYVEYALREDSARHANETHGFDTALRQHHMRLSPADRLAAWVITAIQLLYQYDDLLNNEWRERVACNLLREIVPEHLQAYRAWQKQIPYRRGADAAGQTYAQYRRARFDAFIEAVLAQFAPQLQHEFVERLHRLESEDCQEYQRQMAILAYLQPDAYRETRLRYPVAQAHIGMIHRGHYYLIPAAQPGQPQPLGVAAVRSLVAAILDSVPDAAPGRLIPLARAPRPELAALRAKLSVPLAHEINSLRLAPILFNTDLRPRALPLAEIRQAERGIGDHPLTIFDTGHTFVFDQSHIFFDGGWGAALAEIMTNEALSWAFYLASQPPAATAERPPYRLALNFLPDDHDLIRGAAQLAPEAAAETDAVDMNALSHLRRVFKQRSELLGLTINDLLVLYRAIHAFTYQPEADLLAALDELTASKETRPAAKAALDALEPARQTPALLIPIDASQRSPRERLYPFSFEVPLAELDILGLHQRSLAALAHNQSHPLETRGQDPLSPLPSPLTIPEQDSPDDFTLLRRTYLAALAGFGEVLSRAKELAGQGQSPSIGAIKALAHLPTPVQRLLDQLPAALEPLNDLLKGREVFSNIGAVAPGSTLTRFYSAKDDNKQKTLVWGVMTDDHGVMHISLRDFRPHVGALASANRLDLAQRITRHYLDSYTHGLNQYIREVYQIAIAVLH